MKTKETGHTTEMQDLNKQFQAIVEKLVDSFGKQELSKFDQYVPTSLKHYTQEQLPWIEKLMKKIQELPTNENQSLTLEDCLLNTTISQKFRAIYVLLHPELVIHQNFI